MLENRPQLLGFESWEEDLEMMKAGCPVFGKLGTHSAFFAVEVCGFEIVDVRIRVVWDGGLSASRSGVDETR